MLFNIRECFARPVGYAMRSIVLYGLIMLSLATAHAQTVTVNALTATPAVAQPGQTVVFSATMTASANASNYPVEFSVVGNDGVVPTSFTAGTPVTAKYSWTVPAGTTVGAKTISLGVYNSQWQVPALAYASTSFSVSSASTDAAVSAAAPAVSQLPVISGTAQVGKVLKSSTGTWTGATSFVYKWAGNGAGIAGATASTYTPVAGDVGHALTATVTATGANGAASATSAPTASIAAASSGVSSFVPLHKYFISPTGSDSNNGTSATACGTNCGPWRSPNHPVACGDVIVAAAGAYSGNPSPFEQGNWGTVSSCPSASGGIDGTGGVYFANVVCATPFACTIAAAGASSGFRVDRSNWAVTGFTVSSTGNTCYQAVALKGTPIHHIAFINDIASGCWQNGFDSNDAGQSLGGVDQWALVGAIAYGAGSNWGLCNSGVSVAGPISYDQSAGTHVFVGGVFSYRNINPAAGCNGATTTSDGEGIIFDTWDVHPYTGQGVIEQTVTWGNGSSGIQVFETQSTSAPRIFVFNNTVYGNYQDPSHAGSTMGELTIQNAKTSPISITNNLLQSSVKTPGNAKRNSANNTGGNVYASLIGAPYPTTVTSNFMKSLQTSCDAVCDSADSAIAWNGYKYGANTYAAPGFANPAGLPTTAPNCAGYSTTTACMIGAGVVANLTPSGAAAGKGYQPPGPCAADPYFPTWLKGAVHVSVSGTNLVYSSGLITKPCGM